MLTVSWELALRADGYADGTVKAYQNVVRSLADWLAQQHSEVGRPSWIAGISGAGRCTPSVPVQ